MILVYMHVIILKVQAVGTPVGALGRIYPIGLGLVPSGFHGRVITKDCSAGSPISLGLVPFGFCGSLAEWFAHSVLVGRAMLYYYYMCVCLVLTFVQVHTQPSGYTSAFGFINDSAW